jgi:hypothetical protein
MAVELQPRTMGRKHRFRSKFFTTLLHSDNQRRGGRMFFLFVALIPKKIHDLTSLLGARLVNVFLVALVIGGIGGSLGQGNAQTRHNGASRRNSIPSFQDPR